jgi:hypothetical protein
VRQGGGQRRFRRQRPLNLDDAEKDLKVFPIELVKHDAALNGGAHQKEIRDVFKRRALKF